MSYAKISIICWRTSEGGAPPNLPHRNGICVACGAGVAVHLSSIRRVKQLGAKPALVCFRCAEKKDGIGIVPVTKEQAKEMGTSAEEVHRMLPLLLPKSHLIGD